MTDLSASVPWLAGGLTSVASLFIGRRQSSGSFLAAVFMTALKALGLGVAAMFLASALHTTCIESLHLCRSRGDGNIGIALAAMLGTPLYWFLMLAASATARRTVKPAVHPHPSAGASATPPPRRHADPPRSRH